MAVASWYLLMDSRICSNFYCLSTANHWSPAPSASSCHAITCSSLPILYLPRPFCPYLLYITVSFLVCLQVYVYLETIKSPFFRPTAVSIHQFLLPPMSMLIDLVPFGVPSARHNQVRSNYDSRLICDWTTLQAILDNGSNQTNACPSSTACL
jgi:hypothetical protein